MKEITLPERIGADDNGKAFGLAEFLTDLLFTRPDLLRDTGFCEMVVDLMPELKKLHGADQVGQPFRLADDHHQRLLACDWSNPRIVQHLPETAFTIAQFRLAVKRAVEVKEGQPVASQKTNGKQAKTTAEA